MRKQLSLLFFVLLCLPVFSATIEVPKPILVNQNNTFYLEDFEEVGATVEVNGVETDVFLTSEGKFEFQYLVQPKDDAIHVVWESDSAHLEIKKFPLFLSILPPLLAILLAFVFKEVLISLFIGVLSGVAILLIYTKGFTNLWELPLVTTTDFILPAAADEDHVAIILFSMMIAGMVGIIRKNGGMQALVTSFSSWANTKKKGQLATYGLGLAIFFDDYANTLVVGNTMRAITDKLKISREKLAYIVDSTAAPIASIAFITTWVGAELSYIQEGINQISLMGVSAYSLFIQSISYSFYPILTLVFMFFIIYTGKDFGPMLQAEANPKYPKEKIESEEELVAKSSWYFAFVPVVVLLLVTSFGLYYTGTAGFKETNKSLSQILGSSNSYYALLWGSFSGLFTAYLLSVLSKKLNIEKAADATIQGFGSMLTSMVILILAWSLAKLTQQLHTTAFLTAVFENNISIAFLPALVFIISAITAFATGSSWGTMAILYPLAIPSIWTVCINSGISEADAMPYLLNAISTVLAGSVLGDHCSPISDTTILSSMATQCNHIAHVRTQIPYALSVGAVALFIGTIPVSFGVPTTVSLLVGIGVLYGIIHLFGKRLTP